MAVTVPGVDIQRIVQTQRTATLRHLQDLTKLKRATSDEAGGRGPGQRNELAWLLVLDNLVYAAEAEIRWLDHVESQLAREATHLPRPSPATPKVRARTGPLRERRDDCQPSI